MTIDPNGNDTYLVVINLFHSDRPLREQLAQVHHAIKALCTDVSGPIFNSKDARDFALFVRTNLSAKKLLRALESGSEATNKNPAIQTGDKILVVGVGQDCAALGFNTIWKFLFEWRRKPNFYK